MKNYREGVGIMLLNTENLVFTGQRTNSLLETWQMPQGGIEQGETPLEAVWRELYEEVGSKNARLIDSLPKWLYYNLPKSLQNQLWGRKFVGQKQQWFLLRFLGKDSDININYSGEFKAWKWQPIDKLVELVVPFKKELYKEVIAFFEKSIFL